MQTTRLYIPPRTYLQTVWRVVDDTGAVTWQAWTSCHDRNAPFNEMLGTSLHLEPEGGVTRVTIRPDDTEHMFAVMPRVGEE